jgi:hypothetical protein
MHETEKIVSYILRKGSVSRRELQQRIKGKYSTRDVADMLKGSIEARVIIKTMNGYAKPVEPLRPRDGVWFS